MDFVSFRGKMKSISKPPVLENVFLWIITRTYDTSIISISDKLRQKRTASFCPISLWIQVLPTLSVFAVILIAVRVLNRRMSDVIFLFCSAKFHPCKISRNITA